MLKYPPDKQSVAQHNTAYAEWQQEHGDDAQAIEALIAEHAEILRATSKSSRPSEAPRRVSAIAVQMAEMVSGTSVKFPSSR